MDAVVAAASLAEGAGEVGVVAGSAFEGGQAVGWDGVGGGDGRVRVAG